MPLPNPSNRRPTGRIGARPAGGPPSTRRVSGAPQVRAPQPQDPLDDDGRPVAGKRGEVPAGPDKRLVWGAVGGGLLLVLVIVIFQIVKKKPADETAKKAPEKTASSTGWPSAETEEGRKELEKMFNTASPDKVSRYLGTIGAETAMKIKDILIPYMMKQDAGRGLNDAWNIAEKLYKVKDERVLSKIIDLAKQNESACSLFKTYGAMGSQGVIDRATADQPENAGAYYKMLLQCNPEEATGPMVTAAENSAAPHVAWICGDALYKRGIAIKLERAQAWLADANPRARASGVRQMAIQKGADRDAALAPFSAPEASAEERMAVLEVLTEHHDLSTDHMKRLLSTDDQEFFSTCMDKVHGMRLVEYIPVLEEMSSTGTMNWKSRRIGSTLEALKNVQRNSKH